MLLYKIQVKVGAHVLYNYRYIHLHACLTSHRHTVVNSFCSQKLCTHNNNLHINNTLALLFS